MPLLDQRKILSSRLGTVGGGHRRPQKLAYVLNLADQDAGEECLKRGLLD